MVAMKTSLCRRYEGVPFISRALRGSIVESQSESPVSAKRSFLSCKTISRWRENSDARLTANTQSLSAQDIAEAIEAMASTEKA